ncbi:DNA primase [Candidatus Methylospira mobilis]|uniref:DNA primase n=1 Tax=Candidatus Methylospira mobilis TaxID=1808979 RepID=A0A5Q0BLM5_9GAMM|nr:DNA primase [Candidatus Methylospira mobilis]QFY43124.1 DNA primase [Candidatus Methylospira mobilis]
MMPIEKLLQRLEKVKSTGPGKYQACCPAHDDRTPSLSIKELDDGKLLLNCHAGCGTADIVGAVSLTLADLFPKIHGRDYDATQPRKKPAWRMADVFNTLMRESFILGLALERLLHGNDLSPDDKIRALEACGRIERIHTEVRRYG